MPSVYMYLSTKVVVCTCAVRVMHMYLDSLKLAEDGLVLGIVTREITQHPSSTRHRGNVIGAQQQDQLPQ